MQIWLLSGQLGCPGRAKIGWTGEERAMEQIYIYTPQCTPLLSKLRPLLQKYDVPSALRDASCNFWG